MITGFLRKMAPTHFAAPYKLGHDKTFHLLEARRGRGKSFTMAYWALNATREGVPVIANFHLNHYWLALELCRSGRFSSIDEGLAWCEKNVRFTNSWDEIMLAYDSLVLLDEVNRLFDSQDRSREDRAPRVVFEWLQLSRRNCITLVFAAQSMDWLTPRVRQLFDLLWRAKKEMGRGRRSGDIQRFWLYGADPWAKGLSEDAVRGADYKVMIPFNERILRLYDTYERIMAIPNESRFERFWDVYQFQLETGIVPPPAKPPARSPTWAEWIGAGGAATSAVREERSPGEELYGRHARVSMVYLANKKGAQPDGCPGAPAERGVAARTRSASQGSRMEGAWWLTRSRKS